VLYPKIASNKAQVKFTLEYPRTAKRLMYIDTKRNNLIDESEYMEKFNKAKYENNKELYDKLITEV
jgi:hypothetical protein